MSTIKKIKQITNLFIVESLFEATPNGKIGRTIKGETFYGYQKRRREKARKLPKPMQRVFRAVEKAEKIHHLTMLASVVVPFLPAAFIMEQIEKKKEGK